MAVLEFQFLGKSASILFLRAVTFAFRVSGLIPQIQFSSRFSQSEENLDFPTLSIQDNSQGIKLKLKTNVFAIPNLGRPLATGLLISVFLICFLLDYFGMVSQEILSVKLTSGPFWGIFFHSFFSLEIISILKIFWNTI